MLRFSCSSGSQDDTISIIVASVEHKSKWHYYSHTTKLGVRDSVKVHVGHHCRVVDPIVLAIFWLKCIGVYFVTLRQETY